MKAESRNEASYSFMQISVFHIYNSQRWWICTYRTLGSPLQTMWRRSCSTPLPRFTSSTPCCCWCAWLSSPLSLWPSPSCSSQWVCHAGIPKLALLYMYSALLWRFIKSRVLKGQAAHALWFQLPLFINYFCYLLNVFIRVVYHLTDSLSLGHILHTCTLLCFFSPYMFKI